MTIIDRENSLIVDSEGSVRPLRVGGASCSSSLNCFQDVFGLKTIARDLFLPAGYPASVTPDYLTFQIYDSIQGLSSYIRGMLSNQSILLGLGFGNKDASIVAATLSIAARETIATISSLYVCSKSSSFDSHSKQWRLAADICNDIALTLQICAPFFDKHKFLIMYLLGAVCQAVTGVAGSSTRMALTQHFALQQNAANVAACESAQETAITAIGLLLGLLLARLSESSIPQAAIVCFIVLTYIHIHANIKAMRCLRITRLNRFRLGILFHAWLQKEQQILVPEQVARLEPLLPGIPFLDTGPFSNIDIMIAPSLDSVQRRDPAAIKRLVDVFDDAQAMHCIVQSTMKRHRIYVFLTDRGISGEDVIRAYLDGLCMGMSAPVSQRMVARFIEALKQSPWTMDPVLLNQGSSRISLKKKE
ncbi:Protein root UVB sensitive 3 [Picochlorum sp. SENEW3]|nr:Protein root UVB sensitive 3 [Picochlorum sp. SENEW3]